MSGASLPLELLCELAVQAAREAGSCIRSADVSLLRRSLKDVGSSEASKIVTEVDVRSEAIIHQALQDSVERWDIAFLAEESSQIDSAASDRLSASCFWCVDPLDGTLPFSRGEPGYAVSIALVERSGTPLIGVVYDPLNGRLLSAVKGQGCHREPRDQARPENADSLLVFADASLKQQQGYQTLIQNLESCAQQLGLEGVTEIYGAGAVMNACQVLDYPAACYLKPPKSEEGGGSIWDFAATACIVEEAGGWASDYTGQKLELNRPASIFMNHRGVLYASSEGLARELFKAL